jgi:hypothetical protein
MKCKYCQQELPKWREEQIIKRVSHDFIRNYYGKANKCENPKCPKISYKPILSPLTQYADSSKEVLERTSFNHVGLSSKPKN